MFYSMYFSQLSDACNLALYIKYSRQKEPLFVKEFLGDYKPKFIEVLYTVIQLYSLHLYIASKNW